MPEFKVVVSDPSTGKAEQIEVKGEQAIRLIGLKIGDIIDGSLVGKPGFKLKITGGSGRAGEPMRPDIPGPRKGYFLLSGPPGYHPTDKGVRKRKFVRGNTITDEIVQINTVIVERSPAGEQQ
ncbi:MAG: 30S ribosomal protein S6e [Thermofilum sp.]|uniref:Small ribosomal subunit protein eS6 n=1 Tax=Thermofilum pendens TaxID=2269 RepID=A0A7C4D1L1_THEPE